MNLYLRPHKLAKVQFRLMRMISVQQPFLCSPNCISKMPYPPFYSTTTAANVKGFAETSLTSLRLLKMNGNLPVRNGRRNSRIGKHGRKAWLRLVKRDHQR